MAARSYDVEKQIVETRTRSFISTQTDIAPSQQTPEFHAKLRLLLDKLNKHDLLKTINNIESRYRGRPPHAGEFIKIIFSGYLKDSEKLFSDRHHTALAKKIINLFQDTPKKKQTTKIDAMRSTYDIIQVIAIIIDNYNEKEINAISINGTLIAYLRAVMCLYPIPSAPIDITTGASSVSERYRIILIKLLCYPSLCNAHSTSPASGAAKLTVCVNVLLSLIKQYRLSEHDKLTIYQSYQSILAKNPLMRSQLIYDKITALISSTISTSNFCKLSIEQQFELIISDYFYGPHENISESLLLKIHNIEALIKFYRYTTLHLKEIRNIIARNSKNTIEINKNRSNLLKVIIENIITNREEVEEKEIFDDIIKYFFFDAYSMDNLRPSLFFNETFQILRSGTTKYWQLLNDFLVIFKKNRLTLTENSPLRLSQSSFYVDSYVYPFCDMIEVLSNDTLMQLKHLMANENFIQRMDSQSVEAWFQLISQCALKWALNESYSLFLGKVIAFKTRDPVLTKILQANMNSPILFIIAEGSVSLFDFFVRYFSASNFQPSIEKPDNIYLLLNELNLTADESRHVFNTLYRLYRLRQHQDACVNTTLARKLTEVYRHDITYKERDIPQSTTTAERLAWIKYWHIRCKRILQLEYLPLPLTDTIEHLSFYRRDKNANAHVFSLANAIREIAKLPGELLHETIAIEFHFIEPLFKNMNILNAWLDFLAKLFRDQDTTDDKTRQSITESINLLAAKLYYYPAPFPLDIWQKTLRLSHVFDINNAMIRPNDSGPWHFLVHELTYPGFAYVLTHILTNHPVRLDKPINPYNHLSRTVLDYALERADFSSTAETHLLISHADKALLTRRSSMNHQDFPKTPMHHAIANHQCGFELLQALYARFRQLSQMELNQLSSCSTNAIEATTEQSMPDIAAQSSMPPSQAVDVILTEFISMPPSQAVDVILTEFISQPVTPVTPNDAWPTLLHAAIAHGQLTILEWFVTLGVDPQPLELLDFALRCLHQQQRQTALAPKEQIISQFEQQEKYQAIVSYLISYCQPRDNELALQVAGKTSMEACALEYVRKISLCKLFQKLSLANMVEEDWHTFQQLEQDFNSRLSIAIVRWTYMKRGKQPAITALAPNICAEINTEFHLRKQKLDQHICLLAARKLQLPIIRLLARPLHYPTYDANNSLSVLSERLSSQLQWLLTYAGLIETHTISDIELSEKAKVLLSEIYARAEEAGKRHRPLTRNVSPDEESAVKEWLSQLQSLLIETLPEFSRLNLWQTWINTELKNDGEAYAKLTPEQQEAYEEERSTLLQTLLGEKALTFENASVLFKPAIVSVPAVQGPTPSCSSSVVLPFNLSR